MTPLPTSQDASVIQPVLTAAAATNDPSPSPNSGEEIFTGYLSDLSSGNHDENDNANDTAGEEPPSAPPTSDAAPPPASSSANPDLPIPHQVRPPPALKRQTFDVPKAERRQAAAVLAAKARANILASSLVAIDKLIASKKDVFHAGNASLQAYRARSIQSHLHMVVRNKKGWTPASETAAEAQGFATKWGGRMVRKWTRNWISDRVIPESKIGKHGKSFSLYDDPIIRAELRSYVRSERWAMNPEKLVEFSQQKMVPAAADQYLRKITEEEMPAGLKKYMELELFPRIAFKIGRGVSLRTARRLLQREGFMTAQCNDGPKKSWVLEGEQPLRKKGVGRGLHRSDVICSTVGYLTEAGAQLEYGKNYEGYWDGTMFMVQLRDKIIPAFETAHGAGYQMLLMVDHSQGHCMYRLDALIVSRMNLGPGGKQAFMRNGWWMDGNVRRTQTIVYPADHTDHPGQPKGIKAKYLRDHCNYTYEGLKANMPAALASVSRTIIRKWEHRMIRWMDAYRGDLGPKEAQRLVRAFSSTTYTSHRRVPEALAR
ncbi:hypothetical protein B0H16DRAFT_1345852 [Mycena metata]|uniref:DDE-1 domain-containing protein n=1 Tax=Mycena metata TaxID=1033252 RepID=A0AAD7GWA8_9AGAR|nr:hypothetical protein B0H16DRAFT_1345852 [Mycena metata]